MKKIVKILFIIVIMLGVKEFNYHEIKASSDNSLYVIFSDYGVNKDEEFILTLNLSNIDYYASCQIIIDLSEYFTVVSNTPCQLLINSYYKDYEVYANEVVNNSIRFVALKTTPNISNNFNNLVQVVLKSNITTSDISKYFQDIKITLQDQNYNIVPLNKKYSEGIKVEWLKDKYVIELFEEVPNFIEDLVISNREEDDYTIKIIKDDINPSIVSTYVVSVYIYDYVNSSTIFLSKSIEVVDNIKPIINGDKVINIKDTVLELSKLNSFEVSDNYDQAPTTYIKYYDYDKNEIKNLEDLLSYLKHHTIAYLEVYAIDSSKNKSNTLEQTIKISDTTPPLIKMPEVINVIDTEIDNFNIEEYIKIEDQYDELPIYIYEIEGNDTTDILDVLKNTYQVTLLVSGYDCFLNYAPEAKLTINLIDTTNPVIQKLSDLTINDTSLTDWDTLLESTFTMSDNFSIPLSINYQYYTDELVEKDAFLNFLLGYNTGKVSVTLEDSFGNTSGEILILVNIVDTTPPIIEVSNIENNKKYLSIQNIEYKITDNFQGDVNTIIYLDDEVYLGNTISQIGKHLLRIESTDLGNNKNVLEIEFEIIKNNLIGCGTDKDCYTENYLDIIYIGIILFSVSVFIVVARIVLKRNRTRKE